MLCVIICRPHPRRSSGPPLLRPPKAPPRPARSSGSRRLRRPHPAPSKGDPIWRVWKAAGKGGLMGSLPPAGRLRGCRGARGSEGVGGGKRAFSEAGSFRERHRAQAALTGRSVPRWRRLGEERSRPAGFTTLLAAPPTTFEELPGKLRSFFSKMSAGSGFGRPFSTKFRRIPGQRTLGRGLGVGFS